MSRRPSLVFISETPIDPAMEFGKLKSIWKLHSLKDPHQLDQHLYQLSVPLHLRPGISALYENEFLYLPTLPSVTTIKDIQSLLGRVLETWEQL